MRPASDSRDGRRESKPDRGVGAGAGKGVEIAGGVESVVEETVKVRGASKNGLLDELTLVAGAEAPEANGEGRRGRWAAVVNEQVAEFQRSSCRPTVSKGYGTTYLCS